MAISVYSLGSGSKGNCVIIADGKNNIMIDAGLSVKTTANKLAEIGLRLDDISGILLTHEHSDHIRSLSELAKYLPVYSHADTLKEISAFMDLPQNNLNAVDGPFCLGDYEITPFNVSHDAAHPFGFVVDNGVDKVGYLTDAGYISRGILKAMTGCNIIVLESNHDKELLLRGAYPERLKRRIMSDKGHLCNEETALTANDLVERGAKKIMLAHVSENNNLAELAYWTTVKCLQRNGIVADDISLKVALQRETVIL